MAVQELLVRLGLDSSTFSKKLQGVNKEIKILDNTFEGISNQFKNFENTQEGLAQKTELLKDKIKLLEGITDEAKVTIKGLKEETNELQAKMDDFSSKLTKVNDELDKNEKELSLVKQQYKQVSSSVENLSGIEKVFEEANTSINKHKQIVEQSEKAYAGLDGNINKNKATIESLRLENTKLDTKITEVCKALNLNEKEILNLSNQYSKTTEKIEKLSYQYEKVSAKYGENSEQAKKLKAELDKYNNTAERQKTLLEALPSDIQKLSKAYGDNVVKIEKLELANKNMANTQVILKNKIKESEAEIKKQETAFKEAQEQLKRYGVEADSLEDSIKQVKVLLAQENSALKEVSGNVKYYEERIHSLNEEQIKLQQQLDKTKKNMARKSQEIQEVTEKMTGLVATTQKLNRELAETEIDKLFVGLNSKAEQFETLGNALTDIGSTVKNFGSTLTYGVSLPLATFGATATNTFTSFEERIRKVNAVFGGSAEGMEKQFNAISESARKFGRETEWTAEQVGEAYEYMATAGWSVEKSTESMNALLKLASIDMLDLGTASDIVTDTMTPFAENLEKIGKEVKATGKEFNDAEFMVDIFAQTANKTNTNVTLMGETFKYAGAISSQAGADFRDVATAIGWMANNGIKGSMAGTSLAQGITRLLAPTEQASLVMDKFNIEIAKNSDGGMDLKGTIENLRKAFAGMDKDVKTANAKIIFGQTALKGWLPLVTSSADAYNELSEAIYNSEGASDLFMKEIAKSGSYQFKIMKSAIEDFLIVVGDALAPTMKDITEKIADFGTKLSNWVSKMKDTNPELLSLIGKIGLLGVVVPPAIMLLGGFTEGFGQLFKNSGKAIKSFTNFAKHTKMVASGVELAEGKVGIFAKGIGGLISKFGLLGVGIGAGVVALSGLALAIGENENALSWLQDKWGAFGTFIGGVCEHLNGWFTLVFGNLGHIFMGIGKSIGAFLTGDWRDIDDIWRETWANMENTTAKAMSNIKAESTVAISKIREASEEELEEVEKGFETVYKNISNLTRDNYKDVAKNLMDFLGNTSDDAISIMKGTSDSMAVLFDNIYSSQTGDQMLKQLQENLKGMATSGKYSAETLQSDFEKAFNLIQSNARTSTQQVGEEVTKITRHIGRLAQDGIDNVAINISGTLKSMDEETFNTLRSLGDNWQTLFKNVELGSENNSTVILENLKSMGGDTSKIIDALNTELQKGFDNTGKRITETNKLVQDSTQTTSEAFGTLVETIKSNSQTGLSDVATIFAEGLKTLDTQTILSLMNTSDQWYSILNGTVDESGTLVENFSDRILWNLGWVSEQTPEKLDGFKDGLLQALVDANLITADEMSVIVNTIAEKSQEAVNNSEGTGEDIADNMTPTGSADKVKEELDAITGAYHEKTQGIVDASAKAGEEAQKKFDEKVSNLGKDIQVDSNIINIEALGTQFQNAGTLAVQNFVKGWSNNNGLITEAIDLALTTVTGNLSSQFEVINLNIDGIVQKCALLNDNVVVLKNNVLDLDGVGFNQLNNSINLIINGLSSIITSTNEAKTQMNSLVNTSVASLTSGLNGANSKMIEIKNSTISASSQVQILSNKSLSSITNQMNRFKTNIDKTTNSTEKLIKQIDKVIGKSFSKVHNGVEGINSRLLNAINNSITLKNRLYELNYVSFDSLINKLSNLNYWLGSVRSSARSTSYAIQDVRKPSLFSYEEASVGTDYLDNLYARTTFDMSKYQTRGGYYSSNSMAGKGVKALEIQSQKEQLDAIKEQNDLLRQLLLATTNIGGNVNVSVELDGKQVAKSTAKYMETELNVINKRKNRLGGTI